MSGATPRWRANLRNPILLAAFFAVGLGQSGGLLLAGAGWRDLVVFVPPGVGLALLVALLTFPPPRRDLDKVGLRVTIIIFWGAVALTVGVLFRN